MRKYYDTLANTCAPSQEYCPQPAMLRTQQNLGNKCERIASRFFASLPPTRKRFTQASPGKLPILGDVAANQQFLGLKKTTAAPVRENRPAILSDAAANQQCLELTRTSATNARELLQAILSDVASNQQFLLTHKDNGSHARESPPRFSAMLLPTSNS